MNTQLTVRELLEPLQTVIGVVEKKQTLPILSHVLIISIKSLAYIVKLISSWVLIGCEARNSISISVVVNVN